ncbi:MAG: MarR family transcriptional regulator [Bacteroidetes bacterium]|nr:MAG: MarR family transcriptional regulator [Bacteroidota bacterium]REK07536.1 MAG: MarR family transcriptional regulator [Bacteroidota bacterium]REK37031.1 MAG: MarR family transcriptional regulator [Bacteroidota bacterium]REK47853.1 MAG: MarR family transcriptional regulator [Bacteroidota bacterium]
MSKSDFNLTIQNKSTESKIVASLERIAQAFRVLLWQESKEHSLSPIQVQILIFLRFHSEEKRKVSYLADEFNMTKATISDTVKTLEQKQLITKETEQHDTRSYIIGLTTKGKEIADQTASFSREIYKPIESLSPDDKENLLLSMLNIIRHLNKTGIITIQRMCMTCNYYEYSEKSQKHFCRLLNQNLKTTDLRIDCPEHSMKQD